MKKYLVILFAIAIFLLAMEVKVRLGNKAEAMEPAGYATGLFVKSTNGVVWQITVDNSGVLGTDSIGVSQ